MLPCLCNISSRHNATNIVVAYKIFSFLPVFYYQMWILQISFIQYYSRQMRFQPRINRSITLLPTHIPVQTHRENKENSNFLNFLPPNQPHLKDVHPRLDQTRVEMKVKPSNFVSVSSFIRKNNIGEELKKQYSQRILDDYFQEISSYFCMPKMETQCCGILEKHEITSTLRSKMVDWMIEVLSSYKMSEQSFFKSVYIMDNYLQKSEIKESVNDLHLIGIASMFLASKYEQIHPFKLEILFDKIGRKKFKKAQILQRQSNIIQTMQFQLQNSSVYDIARIIVQTIKDDLTPKSSRYLDKVVLYLSKMVLFNVDLAGLDSPRLAGSVVYVGLKTLQKADPSVLGDDYLHKICWSCRLEEQRVFETSRKVLDMAKNFTSYYPSLCNLKKFNKFEYE